MNHKHMPRLGWWMALVLALALMLGSCTESSDPVGVLLPQSPLLNTITTDTIRVQRTLNQQPETVLFEPASQEPAGAFSIHRAVAFRVAQICAQVWDDGTFYSYQVERVESGWNIAGTRDLFIEALGIPAERVVIAEDATPPNDLSLGDNWYEITFTNGRSLLLWGTNQIFHAQYLRLRDEYLSGNDEVTAAMVEQERQIVERALKTLPFTDKFIINGPEPEAPEEPDDELLPESPVSNFVTTNTLNIQKAADRQPEGVNFESASLDRQGVFSIHRAVAFRISQICAQAWTDGVLYSFHVSRVESGWNIEGTRELFVEVLDIPGERVSIAPDATPPNELTLEDSWYEITFTNGRTLLFQGTEKIYHEYLTLRDEYLSGNDEVTADMVEQERQKVEQTVRTLPFRDMFLITDD